MNRRIVRACGEAGIPIVRSMVAVDLGKAGYADTITEHRRLWDGLVPILDETGVTIGIQNHSGNSVGSAIGLYHLIEKYDPKHVCAILDMAHAAIAGEPTELAVDLLWPRMRELINFKAPSASASTDRRRARPSTARIGPPRPMPPIHGAGW